VKKKTSSLLFPSPQSGEGIKGLARSISPLHKMERGVPTKSGRGEEGYTLVELFAAIAIVAIALYAFMTVLVLLAIITISSVSYIGFFKKGRLMHAADKIACDITYTQNQAMIEAVWHGVHFEPDPINTYYIYQTSGAVSAPEKDPGNPKRDFMVNTKEKFGVTIDKVELEGGSMSVEFDEYGRPYASYNGKAISSEGSIVLRLGNMIKTITISPDSGRVTVQ
jgi:Tfp pilus assembly protein FimT